MIDTVLGTIAFLTIFGLLFVKGANVYSALTNKKGKPNFEILGILSTTALLVLAWTVFFISVASVLHFSETHESVTGATTTITTITNTNYFAYFNLLSLVNVLLLIGFLVSFLEGLLWLRWNYQKHFY